MLVYSDILNDRAILDSYKSRDLVDMKCETCYQLFRRKKKNIIDNLTRGHSTIYCSRECCGKSFYTSDIYICLHCQREFSKQPSRVKKYQKHFCSQSCSASFNNKNKKNGTRRSKLEIWLEEQLTHKYNNHTIEFNRKERIGSELDIYFVDLKLAFELNGIFHFEPIFGSTKLEKIQQNDKNKFQACRDKGISLCIIDTSSQKYFKPKTSQVFLDLITRIVDGEL